MRLKEVIAMMNKIIYILLLSFVFGACSEDESNSYGLGSIEVKFDNIVGDVSANILSNAGSDEYPYTTDSGQPYNLTLVKYIVSEIVFEGADGSYYSDVLDISGDDVRGYYLVDESDLTSQRITLSDIPDGIYDKITFKIGIESDGIDQGASIILDGMFWAWSSGYIGIKIEGQSPDSPGEAFGDTIEETNPYGFGYHIGGWNSPNNVRTVTVDLDEFLVSNSFKPEIHLAVDIAEFMNGPEAIDFYTKNSVHDASSGRVYADNILEMFYFDHVHNNPL